LWAGNTWHEPRVPFCAQGPLVPVVVVVVAGWVVVVIDDDVVLDVLVVDELDDVVGPAGLVVLVVVVGPAAPGSGAAHAPRQRTAVVTDASTSDPRPMGPHRQVRRRP